MLSSKDSDSSDQESGALLPTNSAAQRVERRNVRRYGPTPRARRPRCSPKRRRTVRKVLLGVCGALALALGLLLVMGSAARQNMLRAVARGGYEREPARYYASLGVQRHAMSSSGGALAPGSLVVIRSKNGVLAKGWDPTADRNAGSPGDGNAPPKVRVVTVLDELALSDGIAATATAAGLHLTVIYETTKMHWPDDLTSKVVALRDFVQRLAASGLGDTVVVFVDAFDTLVASDRASAAEVLKRFEQLEDELPADIAAATQERTSGACVSWRGQTGCEHDAPRDASLDRSCDDRIPEDDGIAGFCECAPAMATTCVFVCCVIIIIIISLIIIILLMIIDD